MLPKRTIGSNGSKSTGFQNFAAQEKIDPEGIKAKTKRGAQVWAKTSLMRWHRIKQQNRRKRIVKTIQKRGHLRRLGGQVKIRGGTLHRCMWWGEKKIK